MSQRRLVGALGATSVAAALAIGSVGLVSSASAVTVPRAPSTSLSARSFLYATAPQLISVASSGYRLGARYFASVTASWLGVVARPTLRSSHSLHPRVPYFSVSYTCTLLVGYGGGSSFTQTTSTHSCTFSNLALGKSYGVAVRSVVNYGEGPMTSLASQGFAPLARVTYQCARGTNVRAYANRTTVSCPTGWHLR